jgi:hypothetical protein
MTKLGTITRVAGTPYEVVSILADGGLRLRPLKGGRKSDGCQYELFESVRIAVGDGFVPGVISSVSPLQATVTTGVSQGRTVGSSRIRKAKE